MYSPSQKKKKRDTVDRTARHLVVNRQPHKALRLIDEYLSTINRNDVRLLVLKGNIYDSQGKFAEAKKAYDKAIRIDPNNTHALIDLGEYYAFCGHDYRKALRHFDKVLHLLESGRYGDNQEEAYVEACSEKASILLKLGRVREALKCIVRGLERFPTSRLLSDSLQETQEHFHKLRTGRRRPTPTIRPRR